MLTPPFLQFPTNQFVHKLAHCSDSETSGKHHRAMLQEDPHVPESTEVAWSAMRGTPMTCHSSLCSYCPAIVPPQRFPSTSASISEHAETSARALLYDKLKCNQGKARTQKLRQPLQKYTAEPAPILGSPGCYSAETVRRHNTFGNVGNYVARIWPTNSMRQSTALIILFLFCAHVALSSMENYLI